MKEEFEKKEIRSSTPRARNEVYPDLSLMNRREDTVEDMEERLDNFNEEDLILINEHSLNNKVRATDYIIPVSYNTKDEYRSTLEYFRNNIIRIKYVLETPILIDLIYNLQDRMLQDQIVKVGRLIDLTTNDIIRTGNYSIIEDKFSFPPLNLAEDPLFTLVILPKLSKANQMKMCTCLHWLEKIADIYYFNLNKEYLSKLIDNQNEAENIMMVQGNKKRCNIQDKKIPKGNVSHTNKDCQCNSEPTKKTSQDSSSSSEDESDISDYENSTTDRKESSSSKKKASQKKGKTTQINLNDAETKDFIAELQMQEKLIRIHQPHIPQFDGTRAKFIKFILAISNRFENKDIPDKIKIELTKHFMTGTASMDVEAHKFPKKTWQEFKLYLISRYILDKRATIMEIRKSLDNLELGNSSVNELFMRIREKINLLAFLDPNEYNDTDKLIIQKLYSGIPSNYYYRIKKPHNDLSELLADLEQIENLERSIANKVEYQDPAIKNLEISEVKTSGKNIRTNYNRYQRPERDEGELECRIHGRHKQKDCWTNICGFCDMKNHRGKDCYKQNAIIRDFVERKIQKYGITAKPIAQSLVKDYGIIKLTEEEFEKRLGTPIKAVENLVVEKEQEHHEQEEQQEKQEKEREQEQ